MALYGPGYGAQGSTAWLADQITALDQRLDAIERSTINLDGGVPSSTFTGYADGGTP